MLRRGSGDSRSTYKVEDGLNVHVAVHVDVLRQRRGTSRSTSTSSQRRSRPVIDTSSASITGRHRGADRCRCRHLRASPTRCRCRPWSRRTWRRPSRSCRCPSRGGSPAASSRSSCRCPTDCRRPRGSWTFRMPRTPRYHPPIPSLRPVLSIRCRRSSLRSSYPSHRSYRPPVQRSRRPFLRMSHPGSRSARSASGSVIGSCSGRGRCGTLLRSPRLPRILKEKSNESYDPPASTASKSHARRTWPGSRITAVGSRIFTRVAATARTCAPSKPGSHSTVERSVCSGAAWPAVAT